MDSGISLGLLLPVFVFEFPAPCQGQLLGSVSILGEDRVGLEMGTVESHGCAAREGAGLSRLLWCNQRPWERVRIQGRAFAVEGGEKGGDAGSRGVVVVRGQERAAAGTYLSPRLCPQTVDAHQHGRFM